MNLAQTFTAARPLARHCDALLRAGPGPAELVPALARVGERLVRLLRPALSPLLGGGSVEMRAGAPATCSAADLTGEIALLAGNSLMASGGQDAPLLVSVEARAIFAMVDRAFGGPGDCPDPLPAEFPISGDLMAARVESLIAVALSAALGAGSDGVRPLRREGSLTHLAPFAGDTPLARMDLTVAEQGRPEWTIVLALPLTTLASLLGHPERAPSARRVPGPADPHAAPFRDMPLPMRAVMAEVDLSVAVVSALRVGQVLPVSIARIVPLRVGDRTLAHGTVGAVDDRVAIQITRLS